LPTLEGIDRKEWVADSRGCSGGRLKMLDTLTSQQKELLALTETEVIELLGPPDANELYKRNQKFYYYAISPSAGCDGRSDRSYRLMIRFNAMGLANDVAIVD
jgi:hypothetical protein